MIGKLLFASVNREDPINLISPDLIGASVISNNGKNIGTLVDMMSLPAHDVYVISNSTNHTRIYFVNVLTNYIILRFLNHCNVFYVMWSIQIR